MKNKTLNAQRSTLNAQLWFIICLLLGCWTLDVGRFPAQAATPFSYQFYNSDGTAQTNRITMQAWPPATNTWTVYGTNVVYGAQIITLDPNTNGYGTNYAYPNSYRLFLSNLNSGFFILLPDTTNQIALGSLLTAAPQVAGPLGFFAMVTNWLGYMPSTNNSDGIKFALGYTPATNSYAGLTNAAGFVFATNGLAALTNTLTDAALAGIHAYRPATNGLAAITNVLGFYPLASNVVLAASVLPQIGTVGVTNLNSTLLTNLGTGTVMIWTNLAIGTAPTMGAPDGSLLISTNGNAYVRSNATWVNLK